MNWIDVVNWQAARCPDQVALSDDRGTSLTYAELAAGIEIRAAAWADHGIRVGDVVAIVEQNSARFFVDVFALARLRAVPALINWRLSPAEVASLIELVRPVAVVADGDLIDLLGTVAELPTTRVVRGDAEQYLTWIPDAEFTFSSPLSGDLEPPAASDPLVMCFSSGTTGLPKAIPLTHQGLLRSAMVDTQGSGMGQGDRHLICIPTFHLAGIINSLMGLLFGGHVHLHRTFDAAAMVDTISRAGIQYTTAVPAMMAALVREVRSRPERPNVTSLVEISYGASPIPPELTREVIEIFGCGLRQYYGMTEAAGALTTLVPNDHHPVDSPRLASAGRMNLGWRYRLVAADGSAVPAGEPGELIVKGDSLFPGYWNSPGATAAVFDADGWFHTGDIVVQDADGYVTIVDRAKDMIISGGENVYPAEIELLLYNHPDVREAAIVGIPSERWGETVHAVIVPEPGASIEETELFDWIRARVAHFKCPSSLSMVDELPRNATGKILRRELREPFWDGHTRRVG